MNSLIYSSSFLCYFLPRKFPQCASVEHSVILVSIDLKLPTSNLFSLPKNIAFILTLDRFRQLRSLKIVYKKSLNWDRNQYIDHVSLQLLFVGRNMFTLPLTEIFFYFIYFKKLLHKSCFKVVTSKLVFQFQQFILKTFKTTLTSRQKNMFIIDKICRV